jgi:hypothetical protein
MFNSYETNSSDMADFSVSMKAWKRASTDLDEIYMIMEAIYISIYKVVQI